MGYECEGGPQVTIAWVEAADLSKVSSEAVSRQLLSLDLETISSLINRFCYAVLPTFFRNLFYNDNKPAPKEPRPTAWMDGLRGITALVVFNKHFLFAFTDMPVMPWGANKNHYYFVEFPFIRLLYSGSSALNFFFAVAGYVVSIKSLQLMSAPNSQAKLYASLSSSTFRGIFRLFLTVAAITFIWSMLAYLGAFEPLRPYIEDERKTYFPGMWAEGNLRRLPTLQLQLGFWWQEMRRLTNIFALKNAYSELDPHLWTTILQFRAQMHIYFILLAVSRLREYIRLTAFFGFLLLYLSWDRWEIALYMAGVIIAQLHVLREKNHRSGVNSLPQTEKDGVEVQASSIPTQSSANTARPRLALVRRSSRPVRLIRHLLTASAFTFCLYLLSYANLSYKYPSPGFEWLNPLIPTWFSWKSKFWPGVGTCFFLYLMTKTDTSSISQKIMNHWWPQYMGKLMFSFVSGFNAFFLPFPFFLQE